MARRPIRKKNNKRYIYIAVVIVILVGVAGAYMLFGKTKSKTTADSLSSSTAVANNSSPNSNTISLLATGDWIAHTSVDDAAKQTDGTYNFLPMVADFKPIFKTTDIRFCNDPILNGGESLGIYGYPKFNSPTEFVTDMGELGCNLVNTASNHSFDFTQANITNSVNAWNNVPNMLAVAGENKSQADHDAVHYFTIKGVKFAFLAYTTYSNQDAPTQNNYGVNIFSTQFASSQIAEAKQNGAKIIIVSMRWGTEYSTSVNAEQTADAQFLANQGVSLIIGHGSHELQPVQQLTGTGGTKTLVWYSMGNFLNSQEPPETLFNGIGFVYFDKNTYKITKTAYLPIYMHYEWTAQQAAADNTDARTNLHLYLLEDATQQMIDSQQLKTTIDAQKQRMTSTLNADGQNIPLITSNQI